jgi:hypothetical protein
MSIRCFPEYILSLNKNLTTGYENSYVFKMRFDNGSGHLFIAGDGAE